MLTVKTRPDISQSVTVPHIYVALQIRLEKKGRNVSVIFVATQYKQKRAYNLLKNYILVGTSRTLLPLTVVGTSRTLSPLNSSIKFSQLVSQLLFYLHKKIYACLEYFVLLVEKTNNARKSLPQLKAFCIKSDIIFQ